MPPAPAHAVLIAPPLAHASPLPTRPFSELWGGIALPPCPYQPAPQVRRCAGQFFATSALFLSFAVGCAMMFHRVGASACDIVQLRLSAVVSVVIQKFINTCSGLIANFANGTLEKMTLLCAKLRFSKRCVGLSLPPCTGPYDDFRI